MQLGPPIIGHEVFEAASDGETLRTATAFAAKVTLSLPSTLPAGRYRIGWSAEVSADDENKRLDHRVQLDATTVLGQYSQSIKKKWSENTTPSNRYYPLSGFVYINLTAGAHSITFEHASPDGVDVYTRRARLEAWRVGDTV
jgi:hypothetical protein